MKRDPELIVKILSKLESRTDSGLTMLDIEGYSPEMVSYHIRLLAEEGCVEAENVSSHNNPMAFMVGGLLSLGHELLATSRNKSQQEEPGTHVKAKPGHTVVSSKIDPAKLLHGFKALLNSKSDVKEDGPRSDKGQKWFARGTALFKQHDETLAEQFQQLANTAQVPLSTQTAGPLWSKMQFMIQGAIAELELSIPDVGQRTYGSGEAYSFYKDLKNFIRNAQRCVFIIDPYVDDDMFDLYLEKASPGIQIRLLIGSNNISGKLRRVIGKFCATPGVQLEVKHSKVFHDRVIIVDDESCVVIGQSVKDAAIKKPTYMIALTDISGIKSQYESIWVNAVAL